MTGDVRWQRAEPVEFTGARGGEAPLTWGQQAFWRLTRWLDDGDPYFNLPWSLPVYGRRDLGAVLLALRRLVERHETLRTTYEEVPGGPVQRVAREGRFTVEVFEAGEARPLVAARELSAELAAKGFDYATELPFRCAVVTRDGRPRAVAFALTHLAVDGWSLNVLATDWRSLLAGDELPAPAWQPLDQAAFEREGAGAARGERAFRHWRTVLGRVPRSLFDFPGETPEEQRFVRVGMESAAVAAAAEVLAERWSVSTASVLTTASAVLLATLTGHREVAMQLIVANRHGSQTEAMVGTVVQDGLFVLDLPEGTFADAVRAGHGAGADHLPARAVRPVRDDGAPRGGRPRARRRHRPVRLLQRHADHRSLAGPAQGGTGGRPRRDSRPHRTDQDLLRRRVAEGGRDGLLRHRSRHEHLPALPADRHRPPATVHGLRAAARTGDAAGRRAWPGRCLSTRSPNGAASPRSNGPATG